VLCDQGNPLQCYQPSAANSLAIRSTQTIQKYTVTPSAGANGTISPNTAQTVNSGTTITFTATPNAGYGVNQWLLDGNVVQTGGNTYQLTNITANHTVNVTFGVVTLTPSVSSLALSINCQPSSSCTSTQNTALTGNPRQITIQNTGSGSATNVSASASGLPSGTSITSNTCSGTLNAGSSCTITLTPGSVASSTCTSGTQPVAGTVTIMANGGLSSQVSAYVLGYGCQYQSGFLYSVDDTQGCTSIPCTGSIGGKVISLADQSLTTLWSSDAFGNYDGGVSIWGISEISTTSAPYPNATEPVGETAILLPGQQNCNGGTDGSCDTTNIVTYYSAIPPADYAAGLCSNYTIDSSGNSPCVTGTCYTNWYLPAICEMGPASNGSGCPVTQNIIDDFPALIGTPSTPNSCTLGANCLENDYWGSTEYSAGPKGFAWFELFDATSGSTQGITSKGSAIGVRCSRALT
jgi:hypothetical protein